MAKRIDFAHDTRPSGAQEFSVAEPLTAARRDGRAVDGILWMLPSRSGFWVEYNGHWKTDGRRDYQDERHLKIYARIILLEMVEDDRPDEVGPTSGTA